MNRIYFLVSVELPDGGGKLGAQVYIEEAVKSYCGGLHPDDPFFDLDRERVRVTKIDQGQVLKLI